MYVFGGLLQLGYIALQTFLPFSPFPLFLQLMGTLLLGGWIGIHYDREKMKSKRWTTWIWLLISGIAGSAIAVYYYLSGTLGAIEWNNMLYESVNYVFLLTGCYSIFRIAESVADKLSTSTLARLQQIASYSFGYYLLHPLILDYVTRSIPAYSNYLFHIQIMLRYFAVMGVCFLIIYLCHRFIPFASLFFGKLPKDSSLLKHSKAS